MEDHTPLAGGHENVAVAPQPIREPKKPSLLQRFGIRMLALPVIAVIAIVGAVVNRGTTAADSLEPGDCFMMTDAGEFDRLDTPDCTEAHDSQIIASITVPSVGDYPTDTDSYWDDVLAECETSLFGSLDRPNDLPDDTIFDIFTPVEAGWDDGDRESLCIIHSPSGLTGSHLAPG